MTAPKVLLDVPFPDFIEALFAPHCELIPWSALEGPLAGREDIVAIVTYSHAVVTGTELDRLPGLKVISNYGVGVDHIDVAAASARGVPVGNTPGTVDGATADLTMALLLGIARNIVSGDAFARGPGFTYFDPGNLLGHDVFGATLGIVGMGRIGREVAKRARGFDMRILYHNRNRAPEAEAALGVEYATMAELLAASDFVSLNTPLTAQTRNLVGETELRQMKRTAFLVNAARGAVVDHDALYRALTEGWIAGAAIDVTEPEPLPRGDRLLALDNLLITPHLGTSTFGTRLRMGEITRDNLLAGLEGRPMLHQVEV